jgi:hypothetical protein
MPIHRRDTEQRGGNAERKKEKETGPIILPLLNLS